MEALRINDFIGENGINISIDKLKKFKNKRVEIIILPINEKVEKKMKYNFFDAAGKVFLDEKEVDSLREMSKI